jgi:hypothetical protein
MLHNFYNSLLHERESTERADKFYKEQMNATEIVRYNANNEYDMIFQHRDIDVTLTINGKLYNVSEKFRDVDFGDLYLEIYSKYPHTLGWIHTGNPDFIAYFTPQNVFLIAHRALKEFCLETLFPLVPPALLNEIYTSGQTSIPAGITLNGKTEKIRIIQAHNRTANASWETIGIAVKFDLLIGNGVKIKKITNK